MQMRFRRRVARRAEGLADRLVDVEIDLPVIVGVAVRPDRENRPGVTSDLNVSYFAPAPGGSTVVADAAVLKIGKTLAFVSVDIRRKTDGVLVAQGRMTKFQG